MNGTWELIVFVVCESEIFSVENLKRNGHRLHSRDSGSFDSFLLIMKMPVRKMASCVFLWHGLLFK